jgi:hypothetical protein
MSEPVKLEILWDGIDLELKLIGGLIALMHRAEDEGLDDAALARVVAYFARRFEPTPTSKEE